MACGCSQPGQTTSWQVTLTGGGTVNKRTEIEAMAMVQRGEATSYTPIVR